MKSAGSYTGDPIINPADGYAGFPSCVPVDYYIREPINNPDGGYSGAAISILPSSKGY